MQLPHSLEAHLPSLTGSCCSFWKRGCCHAKWDKLQRYPSESRIYFKEAFSLLCLFKNDLIYYWISFAPSLGRGWKEWTVLNFVVHLNIFEPFSSTCELETFFSCYSYCVKDSPGSLNFRVCEPTFFFSESRVVVLNLECTLRSPRELWKFPTPRLFPRPRMPEF